MILPKDRLQVIFGCIDGHDVELVHQHIENVGRDECQQAGPQADVLYAEIEQGQQDGAGLFKNN